MPTSHQIRMSSVSPDDWEPFPIEDVIHGDPQGRVHWLHQEEGDDRMLLVGVFAAQPARFPYTSMGDETLHVLEGRVTIEVDGLEPVELAAGDVVSFEKGLASTWEIHEPFKEFFVLSD
jgi:uncharacterized cupin superfamily protein